MKFNRSLFTCRLPSDVIQLHVFHLNKNPCLTFTCHLMFCVWTAFFIPNYEFDFITCSI